MKIHILIEAIGIGLSTIFGKISLPEPKGFGLLGQFLILVAFAIIAGIVFALWASHRYSHKMVDYLSGFHYRDPSPDELAQIHYDKAELALREEDYPAALFALEKVLEIDPDQPKALMKIAKIYHYNMEDYQRAFQTYKIILNNIGWQEQENCFYIEAEKGLKEILKIYRPTNGK